MLKSISKTFAQRHYLEYNDSRISENMEWLRKDAALKWELDQIAQTGPNWREHIQAAEQAAAGAAGEQAAGGGAVNTASAIPSFGEAGATPTATTPATEAPTAETGAATEASGESSAEQASAPPA